MSQTPTDIPHLAFTHHRVGIHDAHSGSADTKASEDSGPASLRPVFDLALLNENEQKRSIAEVKRTRDGKATANALKALTVAAASKPGEKNVMAHILEAARTYATEGEIRNAMREVYGDYVESTEF